MPRLNAAKIIRRVRRRLELSQEGLSRLLNATKGAVQHWERGRNSPDLARLLALRQLCAPGPERRELDALVRQTQARVAPLPDDKPAAAAGKGARRRVAPPFPPQGLMLLRRENLRLQRQVTKLETGLQRQKQQLRILQDLAAVQEQQLARLRAGQPEKTSDQQDPSS